MKVSDTHNVHEVTLIDINNCIKTLYVDYYDFCEDEHIIKDIVINCTYCDNINGLCKYITQQICAINRTIELLLNYCDIRIKLAYKHVIFIVTINNIYENLNKHDGSITFELEYPLVSIPIKYSEIEIFRNISESDLNLISNRYMVEFLIDYLTYFKGRLEYYEQEITKSEN